MYVYGLESYSHMCIYSYIYIGKVKVARASHLYSYTAYGTYSTICVWYDVVYHTRMV